MIESLPVEKTISDPPPGVERFGFDQEMIGEMEDDEGDKSESEGGNESMDEKQTYTPAESPKQRYHTPKIYQDAITVLIPLDVTADLKIAIKRTRAKRIASIYKRFPSLQNQAKNDEENNNQKDPDDPMDEDEEDNAKEQAPKKKRKLENVPQPDQFGSVLDYLEAKYVKGVMLDEDDDAGPILDDEKSEGQGSVYSKDSFLDDTDLQRDVAEQVMASTTLTKLELEHEDGDFFVNVGNLEVENDDYGENYDPLQDKENKTTKKRKKPTAASTTPKAATDPKTPAKTDKKAEPTNKKKEPASVKSIKSTISASSAKSKKPPVDKALKMAAKKAKANADKLMKRVTMYVNKLTEKDLPRVQLKETVILRCPKNKKPGDNITFVNPHIPGQKVRVVVPKHIFPGATFKVNVPMQRPENPKDMNKLPRNLQEALDVFGKAYDEWCTAQSKIDSSFETFKEKQGKFDKLAKLFPTNLVTPIDAIYLKQVVRRARQNKYKRSKTAAAKSEKEQALKEEEIPVERTSEEGEESEEEEEPELPPKKYRIINLPTKGSSFLRMELSKEDFNF